MRVLLIFILSFSVYANLYDNFDFSTEKIFRKMACDGKVNEVKKFLDEGLSPDTLGALSCATFNGQKEVVELLLKRGADINYMKYDERLRYEAGNGHTPLQAFFDYPYYRNWEVLDVLLKYKPKVFYNGNYALGRAFLSSDLPLKQLKKLVTLENGLSEKSVSTILRTYRNYQSFEFNVSDFNQLLSLGLSKEILDTNVFCSFYSHELIKAYIKAGMNVNNCDFLINSLNRNDVKTANFLLKAGAEYRLTPKHLKPSLVQYAFPDIALMEFFLNEGVDINYNSGSIRKSNVLYQAVAAKNLEAMAFLIDKGASLKNGANYLVKAVENNDIKSIALLLKAGMNPNEYSDRFTHSWSTPIFMAAVDLRFDTVKLLSKYGAKFENEDFTINGIVKELINKMFPFYPYHRGFHYPEYLKMLKLVLKLGADINYKHPLCSIDRHDDEELYDYLVSKGAVCKTE